MVRRCRLPALLSALGILATICGDPAPASAGPTTTPTVSVHRVSADSPFAAGESCSPLSGAQTHGFEADPVMARSPHGLVAAWNQESRDTGLGVVTARSSDGGGTWTQSVPRGLSSCEPGGSLAPGTFEPTLAVDGAGTTFLLSGGNNIIGPLPVGADPTVAVSRSTDGGATWSKPTTFTEGQLTSGPRITADPTNPHAVAITWIGHGAPDAVWFSRTADDGATWSVPRPIRLSPPGVVITTFSPTTLADGTLLGIADDVPYSDLLAMLGGPNLNPQGSGRTMTAYRSTDHGLTWTGGALVAFGASVATLGTDGVGTHEVAQAPDGSIYVLGSSLDNASQRVWRLYRSPDGGKSWTPGPMVPLQHDTSHGLSDVGPHNLAIAADGTFGVLHDDNRNDVPGDKIVTTDVWLTYSRDRGLTWGEVHIGGPFDFTAADGSQQQDYQQLLGQRNGFGAVFQLGPCTSSTSSPSCPRSTRGPTDVYFADVSLSDGP